MDSRGSIGDGKVRRGVIELGGAHTPTATGHEEQRQEEKEGEETRGPHLLIILSERPQTKG
jgi:hypothetical protein